MYPTQCLLSGNFYNKENIFVFSLDTTNTYYMKKFEQKLHSSLEMKHKTVYVARMCLD